MVNKAFKQGYIDVLYGRVRYHCDYTESYALGMWHAFAFHPDLYGIESSDQAYKSIAERDKNG